MSTRSASTIDRRRNSRAVLDSLLEALRGIDLSGDVFDENVFLDAHGGYCDVFTAKSRKHGDMTVAVKRLRVHILHNKDASKMILRELRIWSSLHHPNVLPLLGYVMHGAYPALVSQWMAKGSLRRYMEKSSNVPVIRMARGIADGLMYLHNQDVVHSDLKSDNILMSDAGEPLLADFGISCIMTSSSTTNTTTGVKGSARWMAVELLTPSETAESGKHTKQTDVWAYGMVVYELLTGRVPYSNLKNDLQVSIAIAGGQIPLKPATLDDESGKLLWSICLFCWQASPLKRPNMRWIRDALLLAPDDDSYPQAIEAFNAIPFPEQPATTSSSEKVIIDDERIILTPTQTQAASVFGDPEDTALKDFKAMCPLSSCKAVLADESVVAHLWSHIREEPSKFEPPAPGRNGSFVAPRSERENREQRREGPFNCQDCSQTFSSMKSLNRHFTVFPYSGIACRSRGA